MRNTFKEEKKYNVERGREKEKENGGAVNEEDGESLTKRERSGRERICREKGTVKWMEREGREREKA